MPTITLTELTHMARRAVILDERKKHWSERKALKEKTRERLNALIHDWVRQFADRHVRP